MQYTKEGMAIAKAAKDSYYSVSGWNNSRKILREGFEAILNNPKTTEKEKSLARLGIDFGDDPMDHDDAAKARLPIMQKIKDGAA